MPCDCDNADTVTDNDKILDMEKESLIQLEINGSVWKTLYKCKYCNAYWEERYTEDRFVGRPCLIRVEKDYVKKEWGNNVLNF